MLYESSLEPSGKTSFEAPARLFEAEEFLLPDLSFAGEGGANPGAFATTPNGTYLYVAQAPALGFGASIDTLMSGSKWSGLDTATERTVVTYSFMNAQSAFSYAGQSNFAATLSAFGETDQALTRSLLTKIASICNVEFVEVSDDASQCGVVRYGYSQQPNAQGYAGFAFFPSSNAVGGDVWIGSGQAAATWDFYRPNLILHETLHALGLKHPFDAGAVLSPDKDIIPNTVMSYSTVAGGTSGWMSAYPSEPMPIDIAALQYLYGAAQYNTGDTTYDLSSTEFQGFASIWDTAGNDTIDASRLTHPITLDLREGVLSDVGNSVSAMAKSGAATIKTTYTNTLSISSGATLENATGTAYADTISGNDIANAIGGGAGNDRLEGRGGNDRLDGNAGLDTAVINAPHTGYAINKSGASYIVSGGTTGTDTLTSVERLAFNDTKIALDLDGEAGTVAKIIGIVFGADGVHNAAWVGIGLAALDGGMSTEALLNAALDTRLGASHTSQDTVALILQHMTGMEAAPDAVAKYSKLIDDGNFTETDFGLATMDHFLTLAQIDFVGLSAHGIEYA
ncbi:MAG: M10 family metallopeptidase C-terminal domain-containing protein [Ramlibacter sp.]|nr:M10 family metallopeptidase C-terminal domain-containing protein [Ramlibacter sp.]